MSIILPYWEDVQDSDWKATNTVGSFNNLVNANDFDAIFESACDNLEARHKTSFMRKDILKPEVLGDPVIMGDFKNDLLGVFQESVDELAEKMERNHGITDIGNMTKINDQLSQLFDNKVQQFLEEANAVGSLQPIKSIDFPIMFKNHITESFKDVVNTEVSPSLIIKKQIEHKIIYAKQDPSKRWEYPQCFFNDEFKQISQYGKGTPLSTDAVALPLFNFDIIDRLTDGVAKTARVQFDITIDAVEDAEGNKVPLKNPMYVELSTGAWIGGNLNLKYKVAEQDKTLQDTLSGVMDWTTGTMSLSSASNAVKKVYFNGMLSNEGNQNTLRIDYTRETKEWKIGEGVKWDSAITLEQLQEHKALMNMDLYKKTYDDLSRFITDNSDSDGFEWLDSEFQKYDGVEFDPLNWDPMIKKTRFDCDSSIATVALPSEYIAKELKFKLDRFLIDISDDVKMDNLKFVIYGNPRYISLLDPAVKWVFRSGDRVGGVKLDYSYGVMTSGDTSVYVVSSKKLNAKRYKTLRIIPFGADSETITFKRYKFSTDIITSKESAYHDTELSGGSQTYVWGTERYKDVSLQAIQGEVGFDNADFITL